MMLNININFLHKNRFFESSNTIYDQKLGFEKGDFRQKIYLFRKKKKLQTKFNFRPKDRFLSKVSS